MIKDIKKANWIIRALIFVLVISIITHIERHFVHDDVNTRRDSLLASAEHNIRTTNDFLDNAHQRHFEEIQSVWELVGEYNEMLGRSWSENDGLREDNWQLRYNSYRYHNQILSLQNEVRWLSDDVLNLEGRLQWLQIENERLQQIIIEMEVSEND